MDSYDRHKHDLECKDGSRCDLHYLYPDAVAGLAVDKITLAVDGTACAGATVAVTQDTGHDTGAERLDIEDHTMTTTITTPVWIDDAEHFVGSLVVDNAATTVLSFIGARVNYTLRV